MARGQADGGQASSRTATSSSSTAATRRRAAEARRSGATEWRNLTDAEFGLNADGGCGAYDKGFRPLGCGISTAEKTFQTYFLTTHNPGGHSSRPRPDNAIYDLADALKELQDASLHADAQRHQPRLFPGAREAGRRQPARPGNPPLARQSERWRGCGRDRGQPAGGRPDPDALRRDDARGRARRQRASADGEGDGELPHHAGRRAEGRPGGAPAVRRPEGRGRSRSQLSSASRRRRRRFGRTC